MKPTPAQIDVLRKLSEGLLLKQVAYARGTCYGSVKAHMREAQRRLHARTPIQAVANAIKEGLL